MRRAIGTRQIATAPSTAVTAEAVNPQAGVAALDDGAAEPGADDRAGAADAGDPAEAGGPLGGCVHGGGGRIRHGLGTEEPRCPAARSPVSQTGTGTGLPESRVECGGPTMIRRYII
ncbi:hypothetical protein [Streptomyces sp. NPDC088246]|uniref:hypothetical protein n=1 Tax=Streptomyces sp. NPDC088246 TaxID=3365842 RepID=UPI00382DD236